MLGHPGSEALQKTGGNQNAPSWFVVQAGFSVHLEEITIFFPEDQERQRRVSMGMSPEIIFRGANSTKGFTSPERNPTSPYHILLCICKENSLALTLFHQPRVTGLVRICIPDSRSLPKGI